MPTYRPARKTWCVRARGSTDRQGEHEGAPWARAVDDRATLISPTNKPKEARGEHGTHAAELVTYVVEKGKPFLVVAD
jgi:hypothetical protein